MKPNRIKAKSFFEKYGHLILLAFIFTILFTGLFASVLNFMEWQNAREEFQEKREDLVKEIIEADYLDNCEKIYFLSHVSVNLHEKTYLLSLYNACLSKKQEEQK